MSKFVNYNSVECQILKKLFNEMPMMDAYIANIVEEYIYSNVRETNEEGYIIEYRTKYGEKDGEYKIWFSNGQLSLQTTYIDGKLDGEYTEWYEDGQLATQTTYVDHKLHGEYKRWYKNGKLFKQIFYLNDKRHGEYKEWWENGQLWHQVNFVNGELQNRI